MNRIQFISLLFLLFAASAPPLHADPVPVPESSSGFSVMQTLEFTGHYENSMPFDSAGTIIFYGGPAIVHIWNPSNIRGFGLGLEGGVELRRYLRDRSSGGFIGVYLGAGNLWRADEENIFAISGGLKLGLRRRLLRSFLSLDVEPYLALGIKLTGTEPEEYDEDHFQLTLYLGTKLDIF